MRLIDADDLKETIFKKTNSLEDLWDTAGVLNAINNAPTVFNCNACKNMGNERECVDCHDYSNYVHYEERPQGEYVDISKLRLMTVEECAGHTIDYAIGWKACIEWIKQGADMRGEKK